MVNVTHDGDHRRARLKILGIIFDMRDDMFHIRIRHTHNTVAEFFDDQLGGIGINGFVLRHHHIVLHKRFDNVGNTLGHTIGKLGDDNRFRQLNVADNLFSLDIDAHRLLTRALLLALHRGHGFLATALTARKRLIEGQLAATTIVLATTAFATAGGLLAFGLLLARGRRGFAWRLTHGIGQGVGLCRSGGGLDRGLL